MNNISIKGVCDCNDLDRKITLQDGTLVVQKENENVLGVFLVIPFRDNKNKYGNQQTSTYCSIIDLDTGKLKFEERCSRSTTERRLLRHLTRSGFSYPYEPDSHEQDKNFKDMRVQVYRNGNYKLDIDLGEELKLRNQ